MLSFRQLNKSDLNQLTEHQLFQLAELIYITDPFIYPAMFYSKEQAISVLSKLILKDIDSMFSVQNIYVAMEEHCDIIGLILWHNGSMVWDIEPLKVIAHSCQIALPPSVDIVCQEYFTEYSEEQSNDLIQIMNVCISEKHRGKGIGKEMLKMFCLEHFDLPMKLYTLANNQAAVQCYIDNGFQIVQECDGFSLGQNKPRCFQMIRNPIWQ